MCFKIKKHRANEKNNKKFIKIYFYNVPLPLQTHLFKIKEKDKQSK